MFLMLVLVLIWLQTATTQDSVTNEEKKGIHWVSNNIVMIKSTVWPCIYLILQVRADGRGDELRGDDKVYGDVPGRHSVCEIKF